MGPGGGLNRSEGTSDVSLLHKMRHDTKFREALLITLINLEVYVPVAMETQAKWGRT